MTDPIINNEPRTLFTEAEVIELLRRVKTTEQAETQKAREERHNYHWESFPLWTKIRNNNTKIISNATSETLPSNTMMSGLSVKKLINLSSQSSNTTLWTRLKSLTLTTKEQKSVDYTAQSSH
ncbi:unnamed protein product [Mucor hiemalis]